MDKGQIAFSARLKQLDRKRQSLSGGYTMCMKPDGLLVAAPARGGRLGGTLLPRVVLFLIAGIWLFKGLLLTALGDAGYQSSLERLAGGTPVEQVGAAVMYPDPLARWIAERIDTLTS